ncbi:hypothetical protein C7E12_23505, partial [Stenotrophomonas maltophilia]
MDGWLQYGRFRNSVQGEGLQKERYDARNWSASAPMWMVGCNTAASATVCRAKACRRSAMTPATGVRR